MAGFQAFCQDHWDELVPRIKKQEVNGIALQPLALQALWAHEGVMEEFDDIIGEKENDADLVAEKASPICCFLEGRTRYSEGTDYEDDYEILVAAGEYPLEETPEAFWVEPEEET